MRFTRINRHRRYVWDFNLLMRQSGKTDFDFAPKEQATLSFQDELDIMESGKH